jgi:sorbose reductase
MFKLTGKVALITGGATGIGFQVGRAFAEAGATVVLAYNSSGGPAEKGVAELKKDFGVAAKAVHIQAGDPDSVEKGVLEVEKEFGRLDIVRINRDSLSWHKG